MLSREVNKLIKEDEKGVAELYKQHMKYFNLIDQWADKLTDGDLLDEYELAQCMEQLTGCLMKLGSTAGALEALLAEKEHEEEVKGYGSYEKLKAHDVSVVKANARDSVSKIRKWAIDFRNYFYSAQSSVITAQSRLKRLTVQKGAKGIDRTGETVLDDENTTSTSTSQRTDTSQINNQDESTGDKNEW